MVATTSTRAGVGLTYQDLTTYEQRQALARKAAERHPNHALIVVQHHPCAGTRALGDSPLPTTTLKFMVPRTMRLAPLQFQIRRRFDIGPTRALFFLVRDRVGGYVLIHGGALLDDLCRDYAADDGMLFIYYAYENTFGGAADVDVDLEVKREWVLPPEVFQHVLSFLLHWPRKTLREFEAIVQQKRDHVRFYNGDGTRRDDDDDPGSPPCPSYVAWRCYGRRSGSRASLNTWLSSRR